MRRHPIPGGPVLVLETGDLTHADVDAIVNAANPAMLGGGGVDGAIHRAAGRRLLEACRRVPADALGVRCPVGEARITPGFELSARHVIHTVGPVYRRSEDPERDLAAAHRSCLSLARETGLSSLAFPALSCGAYGYPHLDAARIALGTVFENGHGLAEVRFVLFDRSTWQAWNQALDERIQG